MLNLLKEISNFIVELGVSVWEFLVLVAIFVADVFMILHTEMPRLEGLLAGILLAWFMARRDKHPVLKALGAPMKLVLDILDMAWDKGLVRIKETASMSLSWAVRPFSLIWEKLKGAKSFVMKKLYDLKEKLFGQ